MASTHLPCARTAENKPMPSVLDQPVNLIEQKRRLLNFVNNHRPRFFNCKEFLPKRFGMTMEADVELRLEQVIPNSIRISGAQKRGLACLTRSPKKNIF